ncbi:hypothetical protein [Candidatus Thiosymbion oneisti]|uniref:hypothetical protein n=1 Tax=Candidatus Thiosymbion oneisti TaxID=589554 RepID=UPI001061C540|nr:hypothetical protein [Candidatus Thiosymbion oneisti]
MYTICLIFFCGLATHVYGSDIRANAVVDLGLTPKSSIIKVSFGRSTSIDDVLVVTSLNLAQKDAPRQIDDLKVNPTSDYVSHLTGWFVVQQQSQELWVGLTLQKGENHGELVLSIPRMLHLIGDYPEIYELTYSDSSVTLLEIASTAEKVEYAKIDSIKVESPRWGEVDTKSTNGWKKIQGGFYTPDMSASSVRVLTIRRNLTELAKWLRDSLSSFTGGLAIAMLISMVFIGMKGDVNNKHRLMSGGIVGVVSIILIVMSGGLPPNFHMMLYEGANLVGFLVPFVGLALLPKKIILAVRKFFAEIRNA